MFRKFFLLVFTSLVASSVIAQVTGYSFSQSSATFSAITGGTVLGTGSGIDDDEFNNNNIGFSFNFNGTSFTQFSVNANGWLCLGSTVASSYTPISNGSSNNVISAVGQDLQGLGTGEVRYQVLGSSPNRTLVVQWLHIGKYAATGDDWNFQIRLSETTNLINIVYGSFAVNSSSATVQVGLRGSSNTDFNNRTSTTTWSATTSGTVNNATCTLVNTIYPATGLTFTFTPPPPCSAPSAQAKSLILSPSTFSISGTFTASASANTYLVVRSTGTSLSSNPVDGTDYTVGSSLGGGTVDYYGSLTSFSSMGLTANTHYYYYIFAANNSCFGTPPVYLTTNPLSKDTSTMLASPINGIKTIGPTGDFFTLTAAFDYLHANGVNGPLKLILQSTYLSSAEPSFPITAEIIPGTSATNKITVYPSTSGLSITSDSTTGTINLDGVSYLYFDGRVNATGTTKDLVINNLSSGYSVQYINGSTYCGLKFCIVKNASQTKAAIAFMGTTGTSGNSNIIIDSCEIRDGVSNPKCAIYSDGSPSSSLYNSGITISNCMIHDFYAPNGGNPMGIGIMGGSTGWTISGNSFYQTSAKSPAVANRYNVIYIAAGDGYSITNNYIGGSAPNCGSSPWILNGNGTPPTIANYIYGIQFQNGCLTANPSSIQGNTIANITLYTNPDTSSTYFIGIQSVIGIQKMGDISPNIIGSATGTGSININVGNGAFTSMFKGIDFKGMYGKVMSNIVGSITLQGASGSTSTYALTFRGIEISPAVQYGSIVVSSNLIGSLTTSNSIQTPAISNPPVIIQGMYISASGSGTMSVANNTIANITNLSSNSGSSILGLYGGGNSLPNIVSGNIIRNFTTTSYNTLTGGSASVVGVYSTNSVPGSIIRSNNIYNLTNTSSTAQSTINGLYLAHSAGNLLVEKNFIHNIGQSTNFPNAQVNGIYSNIGGTYGTFKNNMIQLGINPDGTANNSACMINGFLESSANVDSILNNSIYIGGFLIPEVNGNTCAFNSLITPSTSTPRICLGNIFYNARSGGFLGKHYGIKIAGTTMFPLGVNSNYNMIIANGGTGGTFGSFNSVDQLTFASYKAATGTEMASGSADPNFVAATGNSATADLHVKSPTPVEKAGIVLANVTDDYDGVARSGLTAPDIGADAGNYTLSADVCGPNISYIPMGNGSTTNRVVTKWATITDNIAVSTGANLPRLYYKKSTDNNAFTGNTNTDNGWKYVVASNTTSPFSFTIDYSIINGGSVAVGNTIEYFVVAQDAANNLSSNYPMAAASTNPPVQNINTAPTNVQSFNIVSSSIPVNINVPGTYSSLTGTGGAFDIINQGVLIGNTTINITADLTEPGTVALNAWAEDVPGANYSLIIKPSANSMRTISGTAVNTGVAMIRTNGAKRFTIDGGTGKYLTFRNTNTIAGNTGPTIQFNGGSQNDTIKNCIIENNGTTVSYGNINIGSTGSNTIVISDNEIRDAKGGTTGNPATAIYNASFTNSIKVLNNNISNFNNFGLNYTNVADGSVINGNSFFYNSSTAPTANQYCISLTGGTNNHTISNNYFGGQAPLCGSTAWTNSTTNNIYGIYATLGIIVPSTISNNTIQNFNLTNTGAASFYGIYITSGVLNVLNNIVGSTTVLNSISSAGTGTFNGIYLASSGTALNNLHGNILSGISYTNASNSSNLNFIYLVTGLFKMGTTSPNIIGSDITSGAITYAGTGSLNGIYCTSTNPGNAIENNIIGNWSLTGTTGSPLVKTMNIYSANIKKNKIFNIKATKSGLTPTIIGVYNNGATGVTNEYSNNLISLDGGSATNPALYGFYDNSLASAIYNLYFNNIYISGPATDTSSTYVFYRNVPAFYTLKDNILANNRAVGGTGNHYVLYLSSTGFWNSNYNNLFSNAGPLGYFNAADQANVASWKTASGGDANSQNVDPMFVSSTDLHSGRAQFNGTGLAISGISTDYAGIFRSNPPDIGAFEFTPQPITGKDSVCAGSSGNTYTAPTGLPNYVWTISSGGTITSGSGTNQVTVKWNTPGAQTLSLNSTTVKDIIVNPNPVTAFSSVDSSQCFSGNSFSFNNSSGISSGSFTSLWKFGDATTSTNSTPSKSYSAAGTYAVKLITTSNYGCKDSLIKNRYIRPQPVTAFTINNNSQCLSANNFSFTNTTSGATTYKWNFGDATATSTVTSPSHTYTAVGSYTVKLVSTSTYGCKDSTTKTLDVRAQPVSSFTINNNSQCITGNNFSFTNTATGASSYLWNFGDATATTTVTSPSHTYTSAATFTVKLVSITTYGCKDSTTKTLDVRPKPVTSFNINNNSQCLRSNNFVFTNSTTGSTSSHWNFGDATATSTVTSPSHTYAAVGTYTVKLVSTSAYGCKDSTTKTLDVRAQPVSSFTINNNSQCITANNFSFTNTATGASSYLWNFGDATATTTTFSPSHTYSASGTFTVKLVSITTYGCKDSTTKTLDVRPKPVTSFTINNNSQCLSSNNFVFTNTTTGSTSYLWNFGDASATSTVISPSHTYTTVGTYTVKLVSISAYGCKDSTTKTLDVRSKPVSSFTINNNSQCLIGNNFAFTNTSTGATTNLWNFGDATATSTVSSPSHTYSSSGSFTVKLVSISGTGCKDSNTASISVKASPVSGFSINNPSQCFKGHSFAFTNTSSGQISNNWNFGDSTTSTNLTPAVKSYLYNGSKSVKLVVTGSNGCKDSVTNSLNVRPQPSLSFIINDTSQCYRNNSFVFTNNTSISSGTFSNVWKFGDNTSSTLLSPLHSYTSIGGFVVKLVVTSNYGCKDSISKNIFIRSHPFTSFLVNDSSQCFKGNNFKFTNNTYVASGTFSSVWKFGDNTSSTINSPSHTYPTITNYNVRLITTSNYGCKDSITRNMFVRPHPFSDFTINDSNQCLKSNNFIFTNSSTGASSYLWKFGDANSSTSISPNYTYTSSGLYLVNLIAITTFGCKDTSTKSLNVRTEPIALFNINNKSQCLSGNNFIFTNSTTGASTYLWNYGDDSTSTNMSPSHTYISSGAYIVKLISISSYGCKDSISKTLNVWVQPIATFTIDKISQCMNGNKFVFTNTGTGASSHLWNFGDAATSNKVSISHSYITSGSFVVKLVSTNYFGCKDSSLATVYVRAHPVSSFTIDKNSQCLNGNVFNFSNSTTGDSTSLWKFGDDSSSSLKSPAHSYNLAGTFTVTLVSASSYGCYDSNIKTLNVRPQPTSLFTINKDIQCLRKNNFIFSNTSTGSSTYLWNFGDTLTSTTISPSHIYSMNGIYSVKLLSFSTYGCADSITKMITVNAQPHASFTVNDTNQCLSSNKFVFTNTSTINPGNLSYKWDLGDGTKNTDTNNTHSYSVVAKYKLWLKATSEFNCTDSISRSVYTKAHPKVNIGSDTTIKNDESLILKADTGFSAYLWSSNETSNQITVDSIKYGTGIKQFWVKVTKNGCDGFDTIQVTIIKSNSIDDPKASFEVRVYPNPVSSTLNMELSPVRKEMLVTLTDMNGKLLKAIKIKPNNSPTIQQIDVSELTKGIYYLNISNSGNNRVSKIIKL